MFAQPIPTNQTQAEKPSTADRWAEDKDHYLQLLREVADTGAETLQLVKQCIRRRARDLQNDTVDPEDKWFMGRITAPLTDPRNKFAQDASTAIDTLSRSIRFCVGLCYFSVPISHYWCGWPAQTDQPAPEAQSVIRIKRSVGAATSTN